MGGSAGGYTGAVSHNHQFFMQTDFALDLRRLRRQAGLTQRDCAHLLGVHSKRIWSLEYGRDLPSLTELCTLSLIYGRTFESLYAALLRDVRRELRERLETLPDSRSSSLTFNRPSTLERLSSRLDAEQEGHAG
ncbi:MAG: helix-turn-helix transcriptional regulator [Roseitalea porphyridii]